MNNTTPIHLQPNIWHDQFQQNNLDKNDLFVGLMNCMQQSEVEFVMRYLPANLFQEFKSLIFHWSSFDDEEDFQLVGSSRQSWGLDDVRRVQRWLEQNPNPELAPPVED